MYYRRKLLLSLLEVFGGELEKNRLQILLMCLSKLQEKAAFDFVPHIYGGFSFQAEADLHTMIKYEQVEFKEGTWLKTDKSKYLPVLVDKDKKALGDLYNLYGRKTLSELNEITYKRYPFYAINSIFVENVLSGCDLEKVQKIKTALKEKVLFTIGYEGISLEGYLNKLIKHGIKVLIDVRKNPLSKKYGFNKKQLETACNDIKIKYLHFPELGIKSEKRQVLTTQKDYDVLFEEYKDNILPYTVEAQNSILELVVKYNRVALTCFEANICQCHRKPLAESISRLPNFIFKLNHI